jgi:UDP-N-acetylmuramyl pentapeptide phosphotransferase/UDP-N-acetylglucosamine-1-phosphate transferase
VRSLDDNGKHTQAVKLVTTPGPGHSATLFAHLDGALTGAIAADQVVFRSNAVAGRDAFTGLEVGVIVLSLVMAAGCFRGLSTRLAEYR